MKIILAMKTIQMKKKSKMYQAQKVQKVISYVLAGVFSFNFVIMIIK